MCRLGFYSRDGAELFTPVPARENDEYEYPKYSIDEFEISMTLDNGLMANIESDCLAIFHFNEVPKTEGQEVSSSGVDITRITTLSAISSCLSAPRIRGVHSGWLKGSFGVPGFGVAIFIARAKKGTRRGR